MSLSTYVDLQQAITNWLGGRTDLTAFYPDWITLFEAAAARRLRVRPMEKLVILTPSNPASIGVTGASDNGSGLIRLTVASTSTFVTGQELIVGNVNGTTEANGGWMVTVVDPTHIDLQGSTFANAYISGGTVRALAGQVQLPSDYLAVRRVTWTGNPRIDLNYIAPSAFQVYYPSLQSITYSSLQQTNIPQSYTIEGNTLSISGFVSAPLEFDYYAKNAAVSGALNWLFTNYPDVYLFGALAESGGFTRDDVALGGWKQRRDEIFDEIKMVDFRERPASMAVRVVSFTP